MSEIGNLGASTEIWVSCVSKKRSGSMPAKDLYVSAWFVKARDYVEATGADWRILSAKYGLITPDRRIDPYELTLNKMAVAERRRWADRVLEQVRERDSQPARIVMLAGARYREFLEPRLRTMGIRVDVPMIGMRIGEQLQWLGSKT